MLRFRDVHRERRAMNRRRFLGVAGAAGLLGGCDFSFSDGIFNACHAVMPQHLRTHALVAAAWHGLDARDVWDVHCHVIGNGDSGRGIWINPAMERIWQPAQYVQRLFYMNAGCAHDSPGRVDESVVDRLLNQCEAMAPGFRTLLLAFDWARDETGAPVRERSTFHVPDAYAADLAARHPARVRVGGLVHPYAPDALDRLDAAKARGARAVKWLPSAQGIDPASERCDRFYEKLKYLRLPLISHAGDERAVRGFGEHLGNPLLLRRPLDAGVRVVVAHCASLGMGRDLDRPDPPLVDNFALFARLMDEPRHRANLRGDISAVTQGNRMDVIECAAGAARLASAAAQRLRLPTAGRAARDLAAGAGGAQAARSRRRRPAARAAGPQRAAVRLRAEAQSRPRRRRLRAVGVRDAPVLPPIRLTRIADSG